MLAPGNSITSNTNGQYAGLSQPPVARRAASRGISTPAKKKPSGPPSIQKYLAGDSTYNDQISALKRQLENFKTSNTGQQGNVNADFSTAKLKMGNQRTQDQDLIQNDYASRGILNSGLYTKGVADYDTKYQQNLADLATDNQRSVADLIQAFKNYKDENTLSAQAARQDAIRRRAQQYGILPK